MLEESFCDDFEKLAAVQPDSTTLWAAIDLNIIPNGWKKFYGTNRTFHEYSSVSNNY